MEQICENALQLLYPLHYCGNFYYMKIKLSNCRSFWHNYDHPSLYL